MKYQICDICFKKKLLFKYYICNHTFCKSCYKKWKNNCPSCRSRQKKAIIQGFDLNLNPVYD